MQEYLQSVLNLVNTLTTLFLVCYVSYRRLDKLHLD